MMLICIKQQLNNIWSSIHEKLSSTEAELKKIVAYEKKCVCFFKNFKIQELCWRFSFAYQEMWEDWPTICS